MLFAQQPTPEQIQEAKKQVNADPQKARQQLESNSRGTEQSRRGSARQRAS
jgi:hypothetical protein